MIEQNQEEKDAEPVEVERPQEETDAEHAIKMLSVRAQADWLSEFIDWLRENEMAVCKDTGRESQIHGTIWAPIDGTSALSELLARFFEIDLDAVERHKQRLLTRLRDTGPAYGGPPLCMTPEQKEEQRRNFAYGNAKIDNPHVTREMVDRAAEENPDG